MATLSKEDARQGTRRPGMIWVLAISLALAVVVGLLLGLGWVTLPGGAPAVPGT